MIRRVALAFVAATCMAVTVALAAPQVTFVMTNGDRHTGTLAYHHNSNMDLIENGQDQAYPQNEIAVIEFNGNPSPTELNKLPAGSDELSSNAIALNNGQVIAGKLYDISDDGNTVTFNTTASNRQTFNTSDIARIYMNPSAARSVLNATSTAATGTAIGTTGQNAATVTVNPAQTWTPTGIVVKKGDRLAFQTSGQVQINGQSVTADGSPSQRGPLVPAMGIGGLVARVGNSQPFPIGMNTQPIAMPTNGVLFLGVNAPTQSGNSGSFTVSISRQ